mmetsp:Transcript_68589/g.143066  ORF Transcript_68589/g.143066 Transcript_68589/m.143066 type:complete len:278 (+) Transcript_68589:1910-2743(+)
MCPCAAAFLSAFLFPSVSTIPPPLAITQPSVLANSVRASRSASSSLNLGQPLALTKSMICMPFSATNASSRSRNSRFIRRASSRPIVVFPAPRIPIKIQCDTAEAAGFSSGWESAEEREAPRCCRRWSQYSGYVFSTHSFSVMMRPGRRQPKTPKLMAIRWSSWQWITAPLSLSAPQAPTISIPSSSSPAVTPHFPSSSTMTAIRLHSFTRWFATPWMRVVPFATAASTAAVMKASVIDSMSMSPSPFRVPAAGPWTVVFCASCSIVHPILASKWQN